MARQLKKERTRRRLLRAVVEIIHAQGPAALTTTRVTYRAGIAQPTFYVHFKNMEDALGQVGDWITDELAGAFDLPDPGDSHSNRAVDTLADVLTRSTRSLVQDRAVAEVFLRSRWDPTSPLGLRCMAFVEEFRDQMEQLLLKLYPEQSRSCAPTHAELLVSAVFGLAEGSLDRRIVNLKRAIRVTAHRFGAAIASNASLAHAA